MKMKLGDEIKDIRTEKFFFEKKPGKPARGRDGKGGYGDKNGRSGKGGYGDKNGRSSKGGYGDKNSRSGKGSYSDKNSRGGKGSYSDKSNRNSKPKDVRRDGSAYDRRGDSFGSRYSGLRIKTKWD